MWVFGCSWWLVVVLVSDSGLGGAECRPISPRRSAATTKPNQITVQNSRTLESVTLTDVLFGEVWLCSGQSNMQVRACVGLLNRIGIGIWIGGWMRETVDWVAGRAGRD